MKLKLVFLTPLLAWSFAHTAAAQQQYYDGAASRALCRGSIEQCRREAAERRARREQQAQTPTLNQPSASLGGGSYVAPTYTQPSYTPPTAQTYTPPSQNAAGAPSTAELAQRIETLDERMNNIEALLISIRTELSRR